MDTNASRVGLARVHIDDHAAKQTAERRETSPHAFKVTASVYLQLSLRIADCCAL